MQTTGNLHHQIIKPGFDVSKYVLNDMTTFDSRNNVFYHNPEPRNQPILGLFFSRQLLATRFLLWLLDDNPGRGMALKAKVLVQRTPFGKSGLFLI